MKADVSVRDNLSKGYRYCEGKEAAGVRGRLKKDLVFVLLLRVFPFRF